MILTTISAAKVAVGFFTALAAVGGGVAVEHAVSGPSTAPAHQAAAAAASGAPTGHGVGPDVHGPAGFGLCNAYAHGGLPPQSVPYRNLAAAAGGPSKIGAFCANVPRHGKPGHPGGKKSDHPSGKPSTHPSGKPSTHPSSKPSTHPSGQPSEHPSGTTTSPGESPTPDETPSSPSPSGEPSVSPSATSGATAT